MPKGRRASRVPARRPRKPARTKTSPKVQPPKKLESALASLRAEVLILRMRLEALEAVLPLISKGCEGRDPERFLRELRRMHAQRASPLGTAAIPDLRETLCDLLHMTPMEFDEALVRCWERGEIALEVGSPIGRAPGGHLEHGGKRYYYVRLPPPSA